MSYFRHNSRLEFRERKKPSVDVSGPTVRGRRGWWPTHGAGGGPPAGSAAMNATTLKTLYEAQLEENLKPPVRAHVDRRATRCMLYISRRMPAGELKETHAGRI